MSTCQTCGCKLIDTVKTPIDRSLGFTAMLELYPGFGAMPDTEGMGITTAFLEDWYKSGHDDMWAYAREWIAARQAETFCATCGHLDEPGKHLFAECPRYMAQTEQPCGECGGGYWQEYIGPPPSRQYIPHGAHAEPSYGPNADGNPYAQYTPEHRVWEVAQKHGKDAAAWVMDGNTSQVSARGLVKGIEDGDPAVLDSVRTPALSVSSDGYTEDRLLDDAGWVPHDGTDLMHELCDQYNLEVSDAFWHEVERLARNIIE